MTTTPNTNPLFDNHVRDKEPHSLALARQITANEAVRLLVKDLALHAALNYYAAVMKTGQSFPPRGETIVKTAETFEDYYATLYESKNTNIKES